VGRDTAKVEGRAAATDGGEPQPGPLSLSR